MLEYQAVWLMAGYAGVSSSLVDGRMCLIIKQSGCWQDVLENQAVWSMAGYA
jgi:hypothetical protein